MTDSGERTSESALRGKDVGEGWAGVEWEKLIPRWTLFAAGRMNGLRWRGLSNGNVPAGHEPKDFVLKAILKTIDGVRKWDHSKTSIYKHVCGVISSDISHLANSLENRKTISKVTKDDDKVLSIRDYQENQRHDPERYLFYEKQMYEVLDYLDSYDCSLRRLAEAIIVKGLRGTIEICNELDVSPKALNNLKKRLRRALKLYEKGGAC